jgi:hypothetical protein
MLNVITCFAVAMDSHHTESGGWAAACLQLLADGTRARHAQYCRNTCPGVDTPLAELESNACCPSTCVCVRACASSSAVPLLAPHAAELAGLVAQLREALLGLSAMVAGSVSLER